jgi:glycosyltransferase involved in cell wall biosynthesis
VIRVILFNYSSDIGGAEASLLTLIRYLDRDKINLYLLTCGSGELESYAAQMKISVLHAVPRMTFGIWKRDSLLKILFKHPFSLLDIIRQIFEIRSMIKMISPGILHCNNPKSAVLGAIASFGTKARLIWHVRDVFPKGGFAYILLSFMATFFKPRCIAISEFVFASMPTSMQKRGRIIHNGVAFMTFIKGRSAIRHELAILQYEKVVLCSGRLVEWKGSEDMIKAMTPFIKSAGYHLVFAGSSSYGNADYIHKLKLQCIQDGVVNKVHFIGYRSDIGDIMAAADVLVLASRNEPFGRVLAEAQLSGLPCVAYNEGGAKEIITHGETGLLAEPGNADALCRLAVRLLEDPIRTREITVRAQISALSKWSPKKSAEKVTEMYHENE